MALVDEIPPDVIVRVAANTERLMQQALGALNISQCKISDKKTLEVAEFLVKDLLRLSVVQGDKIACTKYAAYWAFWIRKIQPIAEAFAAVKGEVREITDINSRVALEIANGVLKKGGRDSADVIRNKCSYRLNDQCDGAACVERYTSRYYSFNNHYAFRYLVYSLGRRTFGPHHLAALFDSVLFASCDCPGGSFHPVPPHANEHSRPVGYDADPF